MIKFIKLTYMDDAEVWINVFHIMAFECNRVHNCTTIITNGENANVKETPREINLLIATA